MTDPATLTDAELCEAVAREVLGWCPVRLNHDGGIVDASVDEPGYKGVNVFDLNWPGIGQVVEAMQERGFCWNFVSDNPIKSNIEFVPYAEFWTYRDGTCIGPETAEHENPARAVFEAALAAVRSVET